MKNRLKLLKDFILNTIAVVLPTIILQFFVLPILSQRMDGDYYGWVILLISILSMVPSGLGNVLNNVHMLIADDYRDRHFGDFGCVFIFLSVINIIAVGGSYVYYSGEGISWRSLCAFLIASELILAREYYIVRFWIDLDYLGILINNIILVVGYILGMVFFLITHWGWESIYILGSLFSLIFIVKKYPVSKELFKKTTLYREVAKKTTIFSFATLLSRGLQYTDKLLLFPLLGGMETTIYYVASLMGKAIVMGITPVNSFILSKISRRSELKKSFFLRALLTAVFTAMLGYIVCVLVARPILGLLYPQWVNESMQYVYILTFSTMLSAVGLVVSPVVLKFCSSVWQIVIQGGCLIIYVMVSLVLLKYKGLLGFCYGGVITNASSLVMMIIIYLTTYKEKNDMKTENKEI